MFHKLPITEKEISESTQTPVYSPILCASIDDLGIDSQEFVQFYKDAFADMPWDWYDVKRKQWELLPSELTRQKDAAEVFTAYYIDHKATLAQFCESLGVSRAWQSKLSAIQPWRRRSVCGFRLELDEEIEIRRVPPQAFKQEVDGADLRSLPRLIEQTKSELVENSMFHELLRGFARHTRRVTPHVSIDALKVSAHFMSVEASQDAQATNAPEGPHEDGADFIVSALVVNRTNVSGGISQVFEKMHDGRMIRIFERELRPGEFLFQADTGEEKHFGNDLWHYVTPVVAVDPDQRGRRDIIGLDISVDRD